MEWYLLLWFIKIRVPSQTLAITRSPLPLESILFSLVAADARCGDQQVLLFCVNICQVSHVRVAGVVWRYQRQDRSVPASQGSTDSGATVYVCQLL